MVNADGARGSSHGFGGPGHPAFEQAGLRIPKIPFRTSGPLLYQT